MRAMLVAAGFGTRLSPLTNELPKPAVPIANRPVALYALEHLARSGVREVVANTHHLAHVLERELEPVCPAGVALRFVHEPKILGTGGGVKNAWRAMGVRPDEHLVVFNAKLVFAPDLERAMRAHLERNAIATMVLGRLPEAGFSPVEIEADGRIRRIRGLPAHVARPDHFAMFTGVQILSARAFDDLPEEGDVIEHAYAKWLERGEVVHGVIDDNSWMDVGVTARHYLDANLALARGTIAWPGVVPDADGNIIHPNVRTPRGAHLREVILGADAIVPWGARLERVVAWRGATLPRELADAVVTTGGAIAQLADG